MKPTIGQNNKTTKAKTNVSAKETIVSTSAAPVAAKPAAKRTQAAKPSVSAPAPVAAKPAVVAPIAAKPVAPAPAVVAPVAAKPVAPAVVAPVAAKPAAPVAPVAPAKVELPPTIVTAKIDVGYGNTLFIRGQGDGLSWETGTPLTCVDASTWVWASNRAKGKVVFKLLVNDRVWAQGEDLSVDAGQRAEVAPAF